MPKKLRTAAPCAPEAAACCSALSNAEGVVMTLEQLAARLPYRPHRNTIERWCLKGLSGVRLRSFRVGKRRCVTEGAWAEFQAHTNGAASSGHAMAEAELDRLGV